VPAQGKFRLQEVFLAMLQEWIVHGQGAYDRNHTLHLRSLHRHVCKLTRLSLRPQLKNARIGALFLTCDGGCPAVSAVLVIIP